jgi:hypothetical protein
LADDVSNGFAIRSGFLGQDIVALHPARTHQAAQKSRIRQGHKLIVDLYDPVKQQGEFSGFITRGLEAVG